MINTLEELLEDFINYNVIEDTISEVEANLMKEEVDFYTKEIKKQNLINVNIIKDS